MIDIVITALVAFCFAFVGSVLYDVRVEGEETPITDILYNPWTFGLLGLLASMWVQGIGAR